MAGQTESHCEGIPAWFVTDLTETLNIDTTHPPRTPMLDTPRPIESEDNPLLIAHDQVIYQAQVGGPLWITNGTRPDCLFAVNMRSRYTHHPI